MSLHDAAGDRLPGRVVIIARSLQTKEETIDLRATRMVHDERVGIGHNKRERPKQKVN